MDVEIFYDYLKNASESGAQHKIMVDNYVSVLKKNLHDLYNDWPDTKAKVEFRSTMAEQIPGKSLDFVFECMARVGLNRTEDGKKWKQDNLTDYNMVTGFLDETLPVECPF